MVSVEQNESMAHALKDEPNEAALRDTNTLSETQSYGEETKQEEVERLENWLKEENPNVEVEVHPGRQPLYYYIFGVE
ncbi:MAG: hypothetical protein WA125_05495 [Desulfosporosinus sp.]